MISAGSELTISRQQVDANHDGTVTEQEFNDYINSNPIAGDVDSIRIGDQTFRLGAAGNIDDVKQQIIDKLMAGNAQNVIPADQAREQLGGARATLAALYSETQAAQQALVQARAQGDEAKIEQAKQAFQEAKAKLQEQIRLVQQLNTSAGNDMNSGIESAVFSLADMDPEGGTGAKATFAMTDGRGAGTGAAAQTVGSGASTYLPGTWGGSNAFDGMKAFSTEAYQNSMVMSDNILNSFDSVLQNQNKGKQLMMLFFYFARMAESGDLGAMYQFMKFLTYIISKDKSKQQVDMGKKLIELQDLSRQWTDKLLGMSTDSTDPNSSTEFTKMMTQVKSETDAIATSQKLISQMMEEFAQIVETLTNATKGALEAQGRVTRVVSQIRG